MHFSHLWGRTSNHELDSKHSEDFQARNLQPKSSTIRFSSRPMGDEPRQSAAAPRPPRHAFHPAVPGSGLCKGRTVIICQNAVINLATCSRFPVLALIQEPRESLQFEWSNRRQCMWGGCNSGRSFSADLPPTPLRSKVYTEDLL